VHLVATIDGLARIEGDEASLLDLPFPDVAALLAAGETLATNARCLRRVPLKDLKLISPLGTARAIWLVGLNYHSKARITARALPTQPLLFLKSPSALGGPVELPTDKVDYEGEVAIVIGRTAFDLRPEEVWAHIAGISAANDITARDVMMATGSPTLAKSYPGFGVVGPSVLEVDDGDIPIRTLVNGVVQQDSSTAELIFTVPELVARISRFAVLEPGDVVLTGTPAGTGQDRDTYLRPGDVVEVQAGAALPLRTEFCERKPA
jgi:2-keto-4-pentenoate hydratase/2-oxohepta-3-ene-1,7-dioic acid hydratase in catechol pathway